MRESQPPSKSRRDQSGVALFMVVAAMSMLAILVTDFTYLAQINQKMAFDGLDQLKAHYLAKSGYKLSLMRLKAYSQLRQLASKAGKGRVPKGMLDKIWNFPFFYPLPTNLPGMSVTDKEKVEKFIESSGLEGRFSAVIESESSKYNLNTLHAAFAPTIKPSPQPSPSPVPVKDFDPKEARESLQEYLSKIFQNKVETDDAFASSYRDVRIEDLADTLFAWADRSYESTNRGAWKDISPKGAPFCSVTELHMLPYWTDELYDLLAPGLTASATPGINVNTMTDATLRALVPGLTQEEVDDFFKFRDATDADNSFKTDDEFYAYLEKSVAVFHGDSGEVRRYREGLEKRGIQVVVDESIFKVTVQATVGQASRLLEAWISLNPSSSKKKTTTDSAKDPGLSLFFMRFL